MKKPRANRAVAVVFKVLSVTGLATGLFFLMYCAFSIPEHLYRTGYESGVKDAGSACAAVELTRTQAELKRAEAVGKIVASLDAYQRESETSRRELLDANSQLKTCLEGQLFMLGLMRYCGISLDLACVDFPPLPTEGELLICQPSYPP